MRPFMFQGVFVFVAVVTDFGRSSHILAETVDSTAEMKRQKNKTAKNKAASFLFSPFFSFSFFPGVC